MTEPILYEGMEISPPLNLNLVQDSVVREARYGCRQWRKDNKQGMPGGTERPRLTWHHGIYLVSDVADDNEDVTDNREVYAVNWGRVAWIALGTVEDKRVTPSITKENDALALWHEPYASGYCSVYRHLENLQVVAGQDVISGEIIGQYNDVNNHLHFELCRLPDPAAAAAATAAVAAWPTNPISVVSLDPTPLLYRFEAEGWARTQGEEIERDSHRDYRKIDRLRIVPWRTTHEITQNAAWFLQVIREGYPQDYYYLPIAVAMPHELLMIEVLRDAFKAKARVKLLWRASHFFGERSMIEDVRVKY